VGCEAELSGLALSPSTYTDFQKLPAPGAVAVVAALGPPRPRDARSPGSSSSWQQRTRTESGKPLETRSLARSHTVRTQSLLLRTLDGSTGLRLGRPRLSLPSPHPSRHHRHRRRRRRHHHHHHHKRRRRRRRRRRRPRACARSPCPCLARRLSRPMLAILLGGAHAPVSGTRTNGGPSTPCPRSAPLPGSCVPRQLPCRLFCWVKRTGCAGR
jgi:hypothetical protein